MPDISDITEKTSDAAIDEGGDAADTKTGGKHTEKVEKVEKTVDGTIGD